MITGSVSIALIGLLKFLYRHLQWLRGRRQQREAGEWLESGEQEGIVCGGSDGGDAGQLERLPLRGVGDLAMVVSSKNIFAE